MHGLCARFCLVEHDAERHVERPEAAAHEVVVQLLDARLVADGRIRVGRAGARARSGPRRARRARGRGARPGCSRARARRRRSARPARCRRGGGARRSPRGAAGTAPRRRTWCCRRRSSWCAGGAASRRCRCQTSFVLYFASTLTARVLQLSFSRGDVVAALEHQDSLAGRREPVGERAAAGARADDDDVVVVMLGIMLRPSFRLGIAAAEDARHAAVVMQLGAADRVRPAPAART